METSYCSPVVSNERPYTWKAVTEPLLTDNSLDEESVIFEDYHLYFLYSLVSAKNRLVEQKNYRYVYRCCVSILWRQNEWFWIHCVATSGLMKPYDRQSNSLKYRQILNLYFSASDTTFWKKYCFVIFYFSSNHEGEITYRCKFKVNEGSATGIMA